MGLLLTRKPILVCSRLSLSRSYSRLCLATLVMVSLSFTAALIMILAEKKLGKMALDEVGPLK
jgi:hypothetical protein